MSTQIEFGLFHTKLKIRRKTNKKNKSILTLKLNCSVNNFIFRSFRLSFASIILQILKCTITNNSNVVNSFEKKNKKWKRMLRREIFGVYKVIRMNKQQQKKKKYHDQT